MVPWTGSRPLRAPAASLYQTQGCQNANGDFYNRQMVVSHNLIGMEVIHEA